MLLKLTEAVLNAWQTGKADSYIYVSFAPGVVRVHATAQGCVAAERPEPQCSDCDGRCNHRVHSDLLQLGDS